MIKQKRHKPEEIILLLRECETSQLSQEQFCQRKQISVATLGACAPEADRQELRIHSEFVQIFSLCLDHKLDGCQGFLKK